MNVTAAPFLSTFFKAWRNMDFYLVAQKFMLIYCKLDGCMVENSCKNENIDVDLSIPILFICQLDAGRPQSRLKVKTLSLKH